MKYVLLWCVLLQSWNEHFFVLTATHLYYTEEQQEQEQDANDDDSLSSDNKEVSYDVPT